MSKFPPRTAHDRSRGLIDIGNGRFAIVDECDFDRVVALRWHAYHSRQRYYVRNSRRSRPRLKLHRFILDTTGIVDHINGDGLDNRRCNLRICTRLQNGWNRKPYAGRDLPKGVRRNGTRFKASIRANGKRFHLGTFATPDEAADAYDVAARKYHGEFAWLSRRTA